MAAHADGVLRRLVSDIFLLIILAWQRFRKNTYNPPSQKAVSGGQGGVTSCLDSPEPPTRQFRWKSLLFPVAWNRRATARMRACGDCRNSPRTRRLARWCWSTPPWGYPGLCREDTSGPVTLRSTVLIRHGLKRREGACQDFRSPSRAVADDAVYCRWPDWWPEKPQPIDRIPQVRLDSRVGQRHRVVGERVRKKGTERALGQLFCGPPSAFDEPRFFVLRGLSSTLGAVLSVRPRKTCSTRWWSWPR